MSIDRTKLPEWITAHWENRTGMMAVNGRGYIYLILEDGVEAPKYFCGFAPELDIPPVVSSAVPEHYRHHLVYGAVIAETILRDVRNGHIRGLEMELERLPSSMRPAYLRFRIDVIDCALAFARDPIHCDGYSATYREDLLEQLSFLHKELRQPAA